MHGHIFLGLGSNVGDRLANLKQALQQLANLPGTQLIRFSSVYETEPVGLKQQNDFLNMAAEVASDRAPQSLLQQIQVIEDKMGRTRVQHWGPRTIDIDILYWGKEMLTTATLQIPHPEVRNRRFVLQPLAEITADFETPPDGIPVRDLLEQCTDESSVACFVKREQLNVNSEMRGEIAT